MHLTRGGPRGEKGSGGQCWSGENMEGKHPAEDIAKVEHETKTWKDGSSQHCTPSSGAQWPRAAGICKASIWRDLCLLGAIHILDLLLSVLWQSSYGCIHRVKTGLHQVPAVSFLSRINHRFSEQGVRPTAARPPPPPPSAQLCLCGVAVRALIVTLRFHLLVLLAWSPKQHDRLYFKDYTSLCKREAKQIRGLLQTISEESGFGVYWWIRSVLCC